MDTKMDTKKGYKFSGLTEKTPQSIQIGAGVFCVNVPPFETKPDFASIVAAVEAAREEGNVLGATRGGGTFVAKVEIGQIDIDDMRNPLPGTQEVTGGETRLTGTLVEISVENLKRILPMAMVDENDGGLTRSTVLLPSHYLENVLWVGNKTDGGAIAIMIFKALNTEGVTLTFTSEGGATMPFSYLAHLPDAMNAQTAPFKIWDLELPEGGVGGDPDTPVDTTGTPIEGMTIQQMLDFAEENDITIPAGVTKHNDIAKVILTALGLTGVKVDD